MDSIQKSLRIVLIGITFILLSGCATNDKEPVAINRYKDIPIAVYGEPIEPAEISEELKEDFHQNLPIYAVTEDSTNQEVILAWVQSFIIASNYAEQLEEAIKPFQDIQNNDDN